MIEDVHPLKSGAFEGDPGTRLIERSWPFKGLYLQKKERE
jgi:hypothetical protein